jgi:hypothetical protein
MSPIQIITFLITILVLFFAIKRLILRPDRLFLRIPVILLCIHVFVFYGYVHLKALGYYPDGTYWGDLHPGDWSSLLRLHSIFTYLLLEFYGYVRDKVWMQTQ